MDIEKCTVTAAPLVCKCLKRKELPVCVCVRERERERERKRERESNALIIVLLWNVSFISHNQPLWQEQRPRQCQVKADVEFVVCHLHYRQYQE